VLEAIVNGRYYFVPFHRVRSLTIEAPEDLRDFVWMPAILTLTTGADTVALIPTRYPGSEASEDSSLRLAKRTEWTESMGGYVGLGQRTWVTDAGELALLDARQLELASPDVAPGAAASD
jgi:type VI secretion system protein ImpE